MAAHRRKYRKIKMASNKNKNSIGNLMDKLRSLLGLASASGVFLKKQPANLYSLTQSY
jgi:hypothetical protein